MIESYEAMFGPVLSLLPPAPQPRTPQMVPIWLKHPKPGIYVVSDFVHGPFRSTQEAMASLLRHHREAMMSPLTSPKQPHS